MVIEIPRVCECVCVLHVPHKNSLIVQEFCFFGISTFSEIDSPLPTFLAIPSSLFFLRVFSSDLLA